MGPHAGGIWPVSTAGWRPGARFGAGGSSPVSSASSSPCPTPSPALREAHRAPAAGRLEAVSACDPLNLVGIVTPGERVPAQPGNRVVFRDGVPVASLEKGIVVNRSNADAEILTAATNLLYGPIRPPQPQQRGPFDTNHGSTQPAGPLPDHGVLEPVPAAHFNLN